MQKHNRKIAVIGLGYVGLPVVVAFGKNSHCVGFDIDETRILALKNHQDITREVSIDDLKTTDVLYTTNINYLKTRDFYIVAVPTPVDIGRRPDLTLLEKASKTVGSVLKKGDIVVFESTVYPGVTEDICVPILEHTSQLKYGVDFSVGYSPERINPGDKDKTFVNIIKVVSGSDKITLEIIANVYKSVVTAGVYLASSIKVAEASKVIENTQRDLNISLMNELAVIFERMQIDTMDVLEAAATKWNFLPFKPGLVGGHCIGVDPYYLTYKAELLGYIPQVILSGRRINDNMGRYIARRAVKKLMQLHRPMQNLKAIVFGFTFKENCPDVRNSKVIDIVNELKDYNISVDIYDPFADIKAVKHEYGVTLTTWDDLPHADLLIIAVSHQIFKNMPIKQLQEKLTPNALIFDVKSILNIEEITSLGYTLCRL